ncbi:type IV secretion system protein VirD4 [Azospirillum fermentarium]|uniref:type IV secretory system conjugative DNA transfer family protein n=1 Tax=Azospirillum fermentarium TaxID=1233114 RepID=UPI0022261E31|nr:type IV secretory system conjugative DNA transfer family protein [Azospirillum fermentarium]MCW2247853.1 type IV secretion system protein VirD4 [Azospirillum fermentarium]
MLDALSWMEGLSPASAALGIAATAAIGSELWTCLAPHRDETATAHGSARWANLHDLRRAGAFGRDGLILGRWPSPLYPRLLRIKTDKHLLTVAPSRAGKGVSAIIPNLLTYPGSVLVIDPKGENASATAARRAAMGQDVHILDPWGITGQPTAAFNPFDLLDGTSPDLAEDATLIAEALVPQGGASGLDPYWETEAKALIAGLILYIVTSEPPELHNLARLRALLTLDAADFAILLGFMTTSEAAGGLVARAANRLRQKPDRERASVISSAQAHTHFLDSPRMGAVLAGSSFHPADLKHRPTTVYLVLPSPRIATHARWLRLLVSLTLATLADTPQRPDNPVLFILDEFAALGRLPMIETAIGLMAGYGVQLWPVIQDLSQLRALYGERWQSFIANAGAVQAFGVNDPLTADTLSRLLGTRGATVRSDQRKADRTMKGGESYSTIARPLLYPAEIRNLPPADELLFIAGLPPMRARKVSYLRDKAFAAMAAPSIRTSAAMKEAHR